MHRNVRACAPVCLCLCLCLCLSVSVFLCVLVCVCVCDCMKVREINLVTRVSLIERY